MGTKTNNTNGGSYNIRATSRRNHNKNLQILKFLLLRSRGQQVKVAEERNKQQRSIQRQGRQTLLSCLLEVAGRMLTLLVARRRPSAHMTSTLPMGSTANLSNVVTLSFNTGWYIAMASIPLTCIKTKLICWSFPLYTAFMLLPKYTLSESIRQAPWRSN